MVLLELDFIPNHILFVLSSPLFEVVRMLFLVMPSFWFSLQHFFHRLHLICWYRELWQIHSKFFRLIFFEKLWIIVMKLEFMTASFTFCALFWLYWHFFYSINYNRNLFVSNCCAVAFRSYSIFIVIRATI